MQALEDYEQLPVDAYWIPTGEVGDLTGFDGVWLLPGSPYASDRGAAGAVRQAREHGMPFLGSGTGFQHALLEFGRNVCGLADASHLAGDDQPACSPAGHRGTVRVAPGSRAKRLLGASDTVEHHYPRDVVSPGYTDLLVKHGLSFTGHSEQGEVRIAELPGHPFFLATGLQPELADGPRAHPFIRAFAWAATAHATVASTIPATDYAAVVEAEAMSVRAIAWA